MKAGDVIKVETGGDLQPPLLPRTYEGEVMRNDDLGFTLRMGSGEPTTFTHGDHLRITMLKEVSGLTGEQLYEVYAEGMAVSRCQVDTWEEIGVVDRTAWDHVASKLMAKNS